MSAAEEHRMDWKEYEKEIHDHLSSLYPGAPITPNAHLLGQYSRARRQIDILIEDEVAGFQTRIVVDGKYFKRRVNVTDIDRFIGKLEDVGATHGLLITSRGYSQAALRRAHNQPKDVLLDVLSPSELQSYQSLVGIPYSGNKAMCVIAPFGWIVDIGPHEGFLAALYQRGRTLQEAISANEWMYVNYWHKDGMASSLIEVMDMQTRSMKIDYGGLEVNDSCGPVRADGRATRVRVAAYDNRPFKEITGYIDGEGLVAFFVLFTIPELETVNTRKLQHVLKYSKQFEIEFDNHQVISALKESLQTMDDVAEKANAYTRIGNWYAEMQDGANATKYYRRSFRTSPTVYRNFRPLIAAELVEGRVDAAKECAKALFRLGPENPRAMQDLLGVYDGGKFGDELRDLVRDLKVEHEGNPEAQVNIGFHYGLRLAELQCFEPAMRTLRGAKKIAAAISGEHPALPGLDELLAQVQRGRST